MIDSEQTDVQHVRVFVDLSNFELSVREYIGSGRFVDWTKFPRWIAAEAEKLALDTTRSRAVFEGCYVYMSFDPRTERGRKLNKRGLYTLDRIPGVMVKCQERRLKGHPVCPSCHKEVETCPFCKNAFQRTEEKGIDTGIVTDMLKLAWEDAYDIAVLVSSDGDFIPAVEFLRDKGKRVIHAGFLPAGTELARKCWASIDLHGIVDPLLREPGILS